MKRLAFLITIMSLAFANCSDAPGPTTGSQVAGQPSSSPSVDQQEESPCDQGEVGDSLATTDKKVIAIYASVIKRAINKPVLRSTRKLNIFERAPREVGDLQTKGRKIEAESQAAIIESLSGWAAKHELSIRFCDQPTIGRWLMLGAIKKKGNGVKVDTATEGGSMELFLARRQGRWVVTGIGRVLNY